LACIAMVIYHACLFANWYHLNDFPVRTGLLWILFQRSIAASFFSLVGVSLYLAAASGLEARPKSRAGKTQEIAALLHHRNFWSRLGKLLICAATVSATSFVMLPKSPITFGILHAIAAFTLLGLPFLGLRWMNVPIAILLIGLSGHFSAPFFDAPYLQWLGLSTRVDPTFDYQPLAPWFGVVLLGITAGRLLQGTRLARWRSPHPALTAVSTVGRHTLLLYMAHVPILMAIMELAARCVRR